MSLITFRDVNSRDEPTGPTYYLRFDALTAEEFSRRADVTTYPVETGARFADHYQPLPREISLTGVVSRTPSGIYTNIDKKVDAAQPPIMAPAPLVVDYKSLRNPLDNPEAIQGPAGIARPVVTTVAPSRRLVRANVERAWNYSNLAKPQTLQATTPPDRWYNRMALWIEVIDMLMDSKTKVDVVLGTGLEFRDMMITEHTAPRVSGSGGAMTVTIELVQIVVTSEIAVDGEVREPAQAQDENLGDVGKKPLEPNTVEAGHWTKNVEPQTGFPPGG